MSAKGEKKSGISRSSAKKLCYRAGVPRSDGNAVRVALDEAATAFLGKVLNHAIICARTCDRAVINERDIRAGLSASFDMNFYGL